MPSDAGRILGRWALAQVAVLALFAPWLAYALPRMMSWSSTEPYSPAFFARLYTTVLTTGIAENIEPWLAPALLVLAVFAAGVVTLSLKRRTRLQTAGLVMLLLGVALPALMVYALTALPGRTFYVPRLAPRYFLPLAGTFYALLGWGVAGLGRLGPPRVGRALSLAGAGIVAAVAVAALVVVLPGRVASDQYVSLVDTLRAHERPGDKVLLYPDQDWPLFAARFPGPWEKAPAGMDFSPESVGGLLAPVWERAEGLWVVTTPKAQEADRQGLVHGWLESHAAARTDWDFGENRLTLVRAYGRPSGGDVGRCRRPCPPSARWRKLRASGWPRPGCPCAATASAIPLYATVYWLNPPTGAVGTGTAGGDRPAGASSSASDRDERHPAGRRPPAAHA